MLRVPVKQVRPGMRLALPLYNPTAPGQPLLRPDYELTKQIIERMADLDIRDIWIKQPGMEAVMEFIDPQLLRDRAAVADSLRDAFSLAQAQTTPKLDYDLYNRKMSDMIAQMLEHPASALYLDDLSQTDQPLMDHCMRVAYIAVLMGLKLDAYLINQRKRLDAYNAQQVTNLGLGAMLHDIGMIRLGESVAERYEETRDTTDLLWRKHVKLGFDMLQGDLDPSARTVALHHHQRYDGGGFPEKEHVDGQVRAQSGDQIHVFARITAVANEFDRLQYPKPGKRLPPVVAMHQMLMTDRIAWFDPVVLHAFLKVTPAYPPGTQVELSNGMKAGTVDHSPTDPCRPTVQLLTSEEDMKAGKPNLLDLRQEPDLHIVKADGKPVADFNFAPPQLQAYA